MLKWPEFYGSDIDNKVQIVCKARVLCKSVIRLSKEEVLLFELPR